MGKVDVSMLNMQATQAIHAENWNKARSLVLKALKLDPGNPTALAFLGFLDDEMYSPPQFLI